MYPMVPGYEMVGVITEMGAEVSGVAIGDTGVGCIADIAAPVLPDSGDEHYCETGFTLSFNSTD